MHERLVTPRLVLEPVSPALANAIAAGDLSSLRPGEGWPHADTVDGLRAGTPWLVLLDGVAIGDCGTHGPPVDGEVEIGYGLAEPYRGRGFGSETAVALTEWLLAQPEVTRVVANDVLADNTPSRRALERAGLRLVAGNGDVVSYARQE
jgi:RimJ/RimL family protein N-acetyltransferase